jgi:hypothetical protein
MPAISTSRAPLHPLTVAGLSLIGVRALGLVVHFCINDPNGNAIAASPFNSLLIALPYHGVVLFTTIAVLLTLWKLIPPARAVVTAIGIGFTLAALVLGEIDLGMQWFIGQRFSPMVAGTYVGRDLFSSDLYAPVLFQPLYFGFALLLMFGPWAWVGRSVVAVRRRDPVRQPSWPLIAALYGFAALCQIPVTLAYGHQREVFRPPELLFAYHWLHPSEVPVPADEAKAVAQLREAIDPSASSHWLDPRYPIVREAPAARNRFLAGKSPTQAPDILVFAVESLRGAELGYVPGNYAPGEITPTPRLDQLARRGVVFSHYLSSGNPSPRGFFGINGGVWDHRGSFIISSFSGSEFDGLPGRLRRAGYFTLGLWGANPSFDNQLFWANKWFDRTRYPVPTGHFVITRPLGDDLLIDKLIDEVRAHDYARSQQPLFAYIATGGTHEPYTVEGETKLSATDVSAIAAERDTRKRYRMVLRNLDAQIGRVLDFLDARPSSRPVVIVIVGDHSDVAGDVIPPAMRGLPNNAVVWTSALIAGPSALIGPTPRVETFPASHPDLTPTLLDLANDHGPTASTGTNLFADIPLSQRRAIAISGQGYRLDRDGWSLFVRRDHPEAIWTMPSFDPIASVRPGLEGSPFTAIEARRLWENINTWSYFIEQNRVWRASFLSRAGK